MSTTAAVPTKRHKAVAKKAVAKAHSQLPADKQLSPEDQALLASLLAGALADGPDPDGEGDFDGLEDDDCSGGDDSIAGI